MRKMTIARALVEVKNLEKRITKQIINLNPLGVKSNAASFVKGTSKSVDEFRLDAKAEYDSLVKLMNLRDEIKRKIILSNAITKVKLGSKEFTVAELIDKKNSIRMDEALLQKLKERKVNVDRQLSDENDRVEKDAQKMKDLYVGGSTKDTNKNFVEQADNIYKSHIATNKFDLVQAFDVSKEIEVMSDNIENFLTEVDFLLSESNARTEIEVSE